MKKSFIYLKFSVIPLFIFLLVTLNGCSSSGDLAETEEQRLLKKRAADSVVFYSALSESLKDYKESLELNSKGDEEDSKSKFEKSLKYLKKIDSDVLSNPLYKDWLKDYNDLAKSITEDYLVLHKDIESSSNVFYFAKKLGIDYKKFSVADESGDKEIIPMNKEIEFEKNSAVQEWIDFFAGTSRGQSFIDKTMYRSGKYFPTMRKILRYHGVPEDLVFLSVQESGLNPTIVSKAGAVGLWQFMPSTGAAYGLYSDEYRDDRRDFEKSSDAAARHLKDLYRTYGDWYLAFAAYNAGPGRVNTGISKSGSNNYWEVRQYLPGETKNYVPSIIALSHIFRSPKEYGFKNIEFAKPIAFDRVNIKGKLTFERIAEFANTDIETIRDLNPELYNDVIPVYDVPYQLRIPRDSYNTFVKNYKKSPEYSENGSIEPEFAGNEHQSYYETEPAYTYYTVEGYNPPNPKDIGVTTGKKKITVLFFKPMTLQKLADSLGVRQSEIRMWNNLPYPLNPKDSSNIYVYLSEKQYNKLSGIETDEKSDDSEIEEVEKEIEKNEKKNTESTNPWKKVSDKSNTDNKKETTNNEKTTSKEKTTTTKDKTTSNKKKTETKTDATVHTVTEGESLGKLASEYGVTVAELKEWNNLESDKILVGQKLKLYPPDNKKEEKKTTKATKHIVEEGENLSSIGEKYGISVSNLKDWNDLEDDVIYIGQELTLVKPDKKETTKKETSKKESEKETKETKTAKTHIVKKGETLSSIADKYNVTVKQLKSWNGLKDDEIKVGQELKVGEVKKETVKKKETEKKKETTKKETTKKETQKKETKQKERKRKQ